MLLLLLRFRSFLCILDLNPISYICFASIFSILPFYSANSVLSGTIFFNFFFNFYLFIYLFMAVLGLRFCARAFSSCGKWGPLFIAVRRPLTIAASLVAEHRLQMCRLSNCGSRAQLLCGMWDLPRPGLEPVSPALAGRLSTTAPPGKSLIFQEIQCVYFFFCLCLWCHIQEIIAKFNIVKVLPYKLLHISQDTAQKLLFLQSSPLTSQQLGAHVVPQ